jgi:hypothetical protein
MIGRRAFTSTLVVSILLETSVSVRRVSLTELKAASVLNFTRFTDWPAVTPGPFYLGTGRSRPSDLRCGATRE